MRGSRARIPLLAAMCAALCACSLQYTRDKALASGSSSGGGSSATSGSGSSGSGSGSSTGSSGSSGTTSSAAPTCEAAGVPFIDVNFASPRSTAIGPSPYAMQVADYDGDGQPDVMALVGAGQTYVSELHGAAGFAFGNPVEIDISDGGLGPDGLFTADLDGDGHPDLVVTQTWLMPLINRGDGTFDQRPLYDAQGGNMQGLAVSLEDDGGATVITTDSFGKVSLYQYSPATATFTLEQQESLADPYQLFIPISYGTQVLALDVAGDGHLALRAFNNYAVALSRDAAHDVVTSLVSQVPAGVGTPLARMADFDGDGYDDFVFATPYQDAVEVVRLMPDGGQDHRVYPLPGFAPSGLEAVDVTGDGYVDIVVVSNGRLAALVNIGGGAFAVPNLYTDGGGGEGPCYAEPTNWEVDDFRAIPAGSSGTGTALGVLNNNDSNLVVLVPR